MNENQSDRAVTDRLAKLRAMPVDASRLSKMLEAQIPRPSATRLKFWRPMRAIAAGIIILLIAGVSFYVFSPRPVEASAALMVQFHEDMISGKTPATKVDSVAKANEVLLAQWADSPTIPDVPNEHIMACCMHSVKNKKMACVLLEGTGEPVTMTVANVSDVNIPKTPTVVHNGANYCVQNVGNLTMVMTERHGRWVCLIGKLPAEKLMNLAGGIEL